MTAALYLWRRLLFLEEVPAVNVSNMDVSKPLIVPEKKHDTNRFVILQAVDMADAGTVQITISSSRNEETESHGSCIVKYGKAKDWVDSWKQNAYLY